MKTNPQHIVYNWNIFPFLLFISTNHSDLDSSSTNKGSSPKIYFPRQSLKIFMYFLYQIKFLLGLSPFVKLIIKSKRKRRGKYCLIQIEIVKRPKKFNYNVEILFKTRWCCPPPPHNFISFVTSFTISKWLKKYFFTVHSIQHSQYCCYQML